MTTLPSREALTVARIVRVNHAGEYGAIRIYTAQIAVAARRYPDVAPALADMLEHEKKHCAAFRAAMPERHSRPCRAMSLWSWGGALLGLVTALMAVRRSGSAVLRSRPPCTGISNDQLHFLNGRDSGLTEIILSIREEEEAHLHHAEERIAANGTGARLLRGVISFATDAVIWLSTWGDSTRMARDLRASRLPA